MALFVKRILMITIAVCLTLFAVGCHHQPDPRHTENSFSMDRIEKGGKSGSPADIFADYRIQPGDIIEIGFYFDSNDQHSYHLLPQDVIEIKFPSTPELNLEQRIRPDGMISMAYIGEVKAAGKTISELKNILEKMYLKKMQNPEMYIVLKEYGRILNEINSQTPDSALQQNRKITVRIDGRADFPMIGEIKAAGKTIPELSTVINGKYLSRYPDLRVELFINQTVGAKICVLGAVNKPGFYPIDSPVSIFEALAMAGGTDPNADISDILMIRKKDETLIHQEVSLDDLLNGTADLQQSFISHQDIVYVPTSSISDAAGTARNIADVIFFRGWGIGGGFDLYRK